MTVHTTPRTAATHHLDRRPDLRRTLAPLSAAAAAMLALAACGGGEGGGDAAGAGDWSGEIRDSAGIEIVTNPTEGLWGDDPAWTLEETFRVGGMDAATEAMFGQIVGIDLDAAGNVYVADQQAAQIRVFAPDGSHLRTLGRPGSGPGEIGAQMAGVFVVGDEVRSPDMANARLNRWAVDGGEALTALRWDIGQGVPIRFDEVEGGMVAQFRDISGMLAAQQGQTDIPEPTGDAIRTFAAEGEEADTLATLPVGQSLQFSGGTPQVRVFEAEPVWDATPSGVLVTGMNNQVRLEVHRTDGTLERVVVLPGEAAPVTEGDQTLIKEAMRGLMMDQGAPPQAVAPFIESMQFAERYPRFAQIVVGPGGSLWLQRILTAEGVVEGGALDFQNLGSDDWDVFDAEGRYLGVLAMPTRFQPLRLIDDVLWGVQRDEFDVPAVAGYRVVQG